MMDEIVKQQVKQIIELSVLHAHYLVNYGIDVNKEWKTVSEQSAALESAYRRGYCEGKQRAWEEMQRARSEE